MAGFFLLLLLLLLREKLHHTIRAQCVQPHQRIKRVEGGIQMQRARDRERKGKERENKRVEEEMTRGGKYKERAGKIEGRQRDTEIEGIGDLNREMLME